MSEQDVFDALMFRIVVDEHGTRRYYNKDNILHRTNGPAVEYADGTKRWLQDGQYHRIDGPAMEYPTGDNRWFINGKELTEAEFNQASKVTMSEQDVFDALKYRIEVDTRGTRWYRNVMGQLHRIGGPAVLYSTGAKHWYQNNRLHRTDGPAIEWASGRKDWYINGKRLTEGEFNQAVTTCAVVSHDM